MSKGTKFKVGDTIIVTGKECAAVIGKTGVITECFLSAYANNSYMVDVEKIDANNQLHILTVLVFEDEMEKVKS
jgi:hypothetical protein